MSRGGLTTMPIITNMIIFGYNKDGDIILEPAEKCLCPACKKDTLKIRSRVRRHLRKEDTGEKRWYQVPVGKCSSPECGRMCRMLPETMAPYKHYEETAISKVLDGRITEESPVDFPSIQTMRRWITWLLKNTDRIEGLFRNVGYRVLGFSEELLFSTVSLLERLRTDTGQWLKITLRFVYNSGYALLPS